MQNEKLTLMTLSKAANKEIKCGFASRYFKRIFRIATKEDVLPEIEKLKPDVVVIDLGLYDRIGGIDTLNLIRDQFDVNAWFE